MEDKIVSACWKCRHLEKSNAWRSDLWGQGRDIEDWTCAIIDRLIRKCVEFIEWDSISTPYWCLLKNE